MFRYTHYGNDNYWACDFETLTSNSKLYKEKKETRVWLAFAKEFNPKGDYQEDSREILTVSIEEFFDKFWELKASATLFFHNLSHDGESIKWYLQENGFVYYPIEPDKKLSKGWSIIEDEHRIYMISVWKRVKYKTDKGTINVKTIQLYIRCSLAMLVLSIDDLGKVYGHLTKGNVDYDVDGWNSLEEVPKEYIEYIKTDVKIMIKPLIDYNKTFKITRTIKKHKGRGKNKVEWEEERETWGFAKLTISSTAKNLFKASIAGKYKFKEEFMLPFETVCDLYNWYYGGLTTFNPKYQYKSTDNIDGRLYDVNSMYPSVMLNANLPIGTPEKTQINPEYNIRMLKLMVYKADIKNDDWPPVLKKPKISMYNYRNDYNGLEPKYVKKVRNGTIYLFEEELESLKRFYDFDYEVLDEYWFKSAPYFHNFVDKYYKKRQEYKKSGDKREFTMKILLNSCYGKFGEKPERENIYYSLEDLTRNNEMWVGKKQYVVKTIRNQENCIGDLKAYKVVPLEHKPTHINVAIAACITMKARVVLQNAIWANKEKFIYCDTDSMFMIGDPVGIDIHKTKLGAWDLEKNFDSITLGGAKLYCLELNGVKIKTGAAGVNKKWEKNNMTKGDYIIVDNELPLGSKLMRQKTKGGVVLIPTSMILKRRV